MAALHEWQNFYILTGTAAATLIGLLFVAISFGADIPEEQAIKYLHAFVNPILIYYFQILLVSCLTLIPTQQTIVYGVIFIILGGMDIYFALRAMQQLSIAHRQEDALDKDRWLWHGLMPFVCGGLLLGTAASLFFNQPIAATILAISVLLGLGVNIHNSWTLTIWLLLRRGVGVEIEETVVEEENAQKHSPKRKADARG
jgi:hypothetical protein